MFVYQMVATICDWLKLLEHYMSWFTQTWRIGILVLSAIQDFKNDGMFTKRQQN